MKNQVIQGDCLEVMKNMPDRCVDMVLTSPPYNKSFYDRRKNGNGSVWKQRKIKYGDGTFGDNSTPEEYENWQKNVISECLRILKDDGSLFYNHKSFSHKHSLVFPKYVFEFPLRQIIIWDRGSTPQINPIRFYPTTEYIFWITKSDRQPKFSNKDLSHKKDVWNINPKPMKEHPAPFPEELAENCIRACSNEGDTILDPFAGSGTVGKMAKQLNRNYILIEKEPEYVEIIKERLDATPTPMF